MGFAIGDTIPPSHKCNEEGPILCLGSPSSPVNWNNNIGIGRPINNKGSGRPAGLPPSAATAGLPPSATTGPSPSATAGLPAKRYGNPVSMTFIVTG